jgi:hypothetical protein
LATLIMPDIYSGLLPSLHDALRGSKSRARLAKYCAWCIMGGMGLDQ